MPCTCVLLASQCFLLTRYLPCSLPNPLQTFLLWLCTFHTNVVTCWLFLSLAILFWLLAGGVGYPDQTSRVVSGRHTKIACTKGKYDAHASSARAVHALASCLHWLLH